MLMFLLENAPSIPVFFIGKRNSNPYIFIRKRKFCFVIFRKCVFLQRKIKIEPC